MSCTVIAKWCHRYLANSINTRLNHVNWNHLRLCPFSICWSDHFISFQKLSPKLWLFRLHWSVVFFSQSQRTKQWDTDSVEKEWICSRIIRKGSNSFPALMYWYKAYQNLLNHSVVFRIKSLSDHRQSFMFNHCIIGGVRQEETEHFTPCLFVLTFLI